MGRRLPGCSSSAPALGALVERPAGDHRQAGILRKRGINRRVSTEHEDRSAIAGNAARAAARRAQPLCLAGAGLPDALGHWFILPGGSRTDEMRDWGSRSRDRDVVVTGAGVLCHFGDDLAAIEAMLREGRNTPFTLYPPGVAIHSRCQIAGQYSGSLTDADLGVNKSQGRFLGRQARLALGAARRALAQSRLERRDLAVVVGSGAGDVGTHVDI